LTNSSGGGGNFSFTNTIITNGIQSFYRLQLPRKGMKRQYVAASAKILSGLLFSLAMHHLNAQRGNRPTRGRSW
jgi:hypothetical protein